MDVHDKRIIHSSLESNWRTPKECYLKLHEQFGFAVDLAASKEDRLCPVWCGPDHPIDRYKDALTVNWVELLRNEPGFLNPPFSKTLMNAYNTGRIKVGKEWVEHEKNPQKAKSYDIAAWAEKCWVESQKGATVVAIIPFAPQTDWYRQYVYGHMQGEIVDGKYPQVWSGYAAMQERRLPHRISFLQPDGSPAGNAGVNSVIVVWQPNCGIVGPWTPWTCYWSYRGGE